MEDVDRSEGGLSADHEQSTEETKLQGNEDMETSNNPTDNVKNDIQESGDLVNKENTNGDSAVEGNEVESEAKDEVKQVAGKEKDEKEDEDSNDEEDEEDVVVLDDIEDDGEDPGEVELEQFNQPVEHSVLADLSEMKSRRKVVLHPVKMSELNHPLLLEAIGKSIEFRTCYVQGLRDGHLGWAGYVEMNFKSTLTAAEAIQTLKTIREDLTVRCLEPGETAKNIIQSLGGGDSPESTRRLISGVLVVKAVAEEINLENLREVFVGSTDIVIPQNQKTSKRMAYVIYDGAESLEEAVKKFVNKQPEINGKPLRIYKYQPNAEMPAGLLRMKRRYRILLQMDMLKKAMKDKKANYSKNVKNLMSSTIQQCKSLIEKDDAVRKELGLSVFSLPELRRYKRIREAVKDDSIWLPGKKMHGPDRRGFLDDEDEEDKQKRYARLFASGDKSESGIPSLMSVTVDPKFTPPILRAQAMGQPVARMPPLGPPLGPPGPLPLPPLMPMRGGPGGPGPRGMMRGGPRGMMRGGPGAFRGGRGGFHDGPPPPPPPAPETFDFEPPPPAFRGRRGGFDRGGYGSERGFDRGGYGRGGDRGGYGRGGREGGGYGRGGDSGGYSRGGDEEGANRGDSRSHGRSDDGGYGRGGINKRPRSPVGGASRNYRSQSQDKPDVSPHASKVPRKESDDSKESKWGPARQDSSSRGGGRGGRGGYRQNQDSSNNWNRSTGPRDQSGGGYGKTGYSSSGAGTYGHHAPSGGHAENYSQPSTSAPPPSNSYSSSTQPSNIGSNMGGYGQQTAPPPAPNMSGYGQTGAAPPMTNYSQQPTSMGGYDQAAANAAAYNQAAASGYSQPGYSQPGYGQTNVTGYGQTQDTNTAAAAYGYTQPTGADYYQAAANYQSGMVSYPLGQSYQAGATTAVPQQQAAAAANQGWGMMTPQQPAQQQQQQYWPTDQSQQATAWSTGTENAATTTPAVDPNAAYGYNWAAAGWKQ